MADSPTTRNRLRKQEVGAKTNAWGTDLNEDGGSDRLDEALDGVVGFALSGLKTLTSTNYESDEARMRILNITGGTGGTITIPSVEKWYLIRNGASGSAVVSNGSDNVSVVSGEICSLFTDGSSIFKSNSRDYVDTAILNASISSELPSQSGNTGKFIQTDGSDASWEDVEIQDIFGLQDVLDTKQDENADLTAIAGLSPANNDFLQRKTGAWVNRTPAQVKVDLALDNVSNTADADKPISSAAQTALDAKASLTGAESLSNKTLSASTLVSPVLQGTPTTDIFAITDGASVTIDPADGEVQTWTLGASRTPTLTSITAGKAVVLMVNDGTAFSLTLTGVTWQTDAGNAPVLKTTGYTAILLMNIGGTLYGWRAGDGG